MDLFRTKYLYNILQVSQIPFCQSQMSGCSDSSPNLYIHSSSWTGVFATQTWFSKISLPKQHLLWIHSQRLAWTTTSGWVPQVL